MADPEPELAEAAAAFDEALSAYGRLGELFLKTPLSSVKHLERANASLAEIAACEGRLQAAGQRMVQALNTARSQQERLASEVVAHVPAVQARNQQLHQLMTQLTGLASEVNSVNQLIAGRRENGDASHAATSADALDVSTTVLGLADRAEALAHAAHASQFEEVSTQAHALHQRLQSIGKKLQKAGAVS